MRKAKCIELEGEALSASFVGTSPKGRGTSLGSPFGGAGAQRLRGPNPYSLIPNPLPQCKFSSFSLRRTGFC